VDKIESSVNGQETILNDLALEIASGKLAPGQRLVALQLSKQFGVKRSKIQEVLKQLENHGLVKIVPNVGAVVTALSQKDVEQTFDLIGVLLGLAVRAVTPSLTTQDLENLEATLIEMENTDDTDLFFAANVRFHTLLTALSENRFLMRFMDTLSLHVKYSGLGYYVFKDEMTTAIAEHRQIFRAVKERKPIKAEQAVRDHLLRSKNRLMKRLNKSL
jgi:DNA-binding GntR family transcriptional regulator